MSPPLPPEHFALQLAFARRVAAVTGERFDDALRQYTTAYGAAGLRPSKGMVCDADALEWHEFLRGFHAAPDPVSYIHTAHLAARARRDAERPPQTACFGYRYKAETHTVQMQFGSNDPQGPLSAARVPARLAELRTMTEEIAREHPDAERVRGGSWLYNLEAYRHHFPPAFVATPQLAPGEYCVVGSWGPFLDHRGGMKAGVEATFCARVALAGSLDALLACFPFAVLRVECDIAHFYAHYGVAPPVRPPEG